MSLRISSPVAILNIVELILSIIIAGLIANLGCISCSGDVYKNQFIDAIVYGYLIVSILVTTAIFIPGNLDKTLRLTSSGAGVCFYAITAWIILDSAIQLNKTRVLAAGCFTVCVVFVLGVDSVYVTFYHDTDEPEEETE